MCVVKCIYAKFVNQYAFINALYGYNMGFPSATPQFHVKQDLLVCLRLWSSDMDAICSRRPVDDILQLFR